MLQWTLNLNNYECIVELCIHRLRFRFLFRSKIWSLRRVHFYDKNKFISHMYITHHVAKLWRADKVNFHKFQCVALNYVNTIKLNLASVKLARDVDPTCVLENLLRNIIITIFYSLRRNFFVFLILFGFLKRVELCSKFAVARVRC